ncbi:MAG: TetR/AcrR family transcriptional regulator [bacterium]
MKTRTSDNGAKITASEADFNRSGRAGSSALRKEKTRRKIKQAARKIFAKKGFEAANVSDIVKSVGVAQGTFYYHFEDKKSILIEMIDEFFGRVKKLASEWARTTDVGEEAAGRFARSIATLLYENRDLAQIVMMESNSNDREIRQLTNEFHQYLYDQSRLGLELGIQLGVVRPMDTRIVAVALVGMLEVAVTELLRQKEPIDLEHVIEEISNLQNFGIRPRMDVEKAEKEQE